MKKILCVSLAGIISLGLLSTALLAQTQGKIDKEMILQVKDNIITLPGNQASKVPITAARFRSSQLRELNAEYNAVKIEKIFKLKEKTSGQTTEIKGLKTEASISKEAITGIVNLANVFTNEIKKEMMQKGQSIVELTNVFILHFEFESEVSMTGIVNAYKSLDVVNYAESITRAE